jgi:hypothetical protein
MKRAVIIVAVFVVVIAIGQASAQNQTFGSFEIRKSVDKMTDEDRSFAGVTGESGKTVFGLRCMEDGLNVAFLWNKYFTGDSGGITVQYRFPPNPAVSSRWDISTSKEMGFLPMGKVRAFITQAKQSSTVVLRVTDRDGEMITDSFKLDGLSEALRALPCAVKE